MAELEGKVLGRYELRRLVGKGGMANVYEAYDRQTRRRVAVKVFKREDEDMLRRFIREAQLMAALRHNHLVPIYDTGEYELDGFTRYYIVMPFMEGGTLRARIRRSPLSLAEACRAIREIASALGYIHSQGIIHRDIKASNVLLSEDGGCYLTDFGIARITTDTTNLTSTGNVLGTVDYVAPELFELDRRADIRSDLYSLGVLLFEMVTGRLPFYAENQIALVSMHMNKRPPSPRSIVPGIPMQAERVILKALEKKPEQRYASSLALADAFCRAVSGQGKNNAQEGREVVGAGTPECAAPGVRPGHLVLAPSSPGSGSAIPGARQFPLAGGTEGYTFPGRQPVVGTGLAGLSPVRAEPPAPPVSPPAPAASRPLYRRPWFSLVLALGALLIIAVSVAALVVPRTNKGSSPGGAEQNSTTAASPTRQLTVTPTPNFTATAQAAIAATATARAQQTATAIAGVTATAQAQASATAGVIQTATSGKPAYRDALNDPNNPTTAAANWDQDSQCFFASDGYHAKEGSSLHGCKESANTYQDAAITVDMRIVSGEAGGLFFRINTAPFINTYAGYLFEVDSAGRYRILVSSNYSLNSTTLKDWAASPAIKHGNGAANLLQMIARGSNFFFYVNGVYLGQVSNADYTSGVVAFLARSDGTMPTEVVYSHLNVYPLS